MPKKPPVNRSEVLQIRALPSEKESWEASAKKTGLPLSTWLRFVANAASSGKMLPETKWIDAKDRFETQAEANARFDQEQVGEK